MTELLLIRHAQPLSGEVDPGLSRSGREQAVRLGRWLAAGERIDVIVTSPMSRALETAQIAAEAMDHELTATLDDLREWDKDHGANGNYTAVEELGEGNPRFEALRTGCYEDFIPAIDRREFLHRARRVVDEMIERWSGRRVAVVSHGGLINAAVATMLGLEERLFFFLPGYTSISTVRAMPGGRRVVRSLNTTGHLQGRHDMDRGIWPPECGSSGLDPESFGQ